MTKPDYWIDAGQSFSKLSLAVQLTDQLTMNQRPLGHVEVKLQGVKKACIKNRSGYYLFLDLPAGSYTVTATADYYLEETRTIVVNSEAASTVTLLNISLIPNSAYPFPHGVALVRAIVQDQTGKPIPGSDIQASIMQQEDSSKAKIGKAVANGDMTIRLVNIQSGIEAGDVLMMNDSNRERIEFCRISDPLPTKQNNDNYTLSAPLKYPHVSGTFLYLMRTVGVRNTRTDGKGEFVLHFNHFRINKLFVKLGIQATGYLRLETDLEVNEDSLTSLGVIKLSSS